MKNFSKSRKNKKKSNAWRLKNKAKCHKINLKMQTVPWSSIDNVLVRENLYIPIM